MADRATRLLEGRPVPTGNVLDATDPGADRTSKSWAQAHESRQALPKWETCSPKRNSIRPVARVECPSPHGLIVKEIEFELLAPHAVVDLAPIPPETKVVPPLGGLNTYTGTVPGRSTSAAAIEATNCSALMYVVATNEPFQTTAESRRKSSPLTVRRNVLAPAVTLLGESEVTEGAGGQEQERTGSSEIASTTKSANLVIIAIGFHLRQTG